MTTDLVTFLRARLADDEAAARGVHTGGDGEWEIFEVGDGAGYGSLRIDSARLLAEVAAKRAILDAVFHYEAKIDGEWGDCCSAETIADGRCECTPVDEIPALLALVQPYATHPDFDPAWSVSAGVR